MTIRRAAAGASFAALLPFAGAALAQTAPQSTQSTPPNADSDLRREIEDQKQRLLILERKLENQQDAAAAAAATAPKITINASRFQIGSTDNSNFIRFRGTLFADNRAYAGDSAPETADTFLLRSVRPTFEGTFGSIYDFRFAPDFGSGRSIIVDAYLAARFNPAFVVTAGKFKPSVGLERLQSEPDLRFMERGLPTLLLPNRDLGLQLVSGPGINRGYRVSLGAAAPDRVAAVPGDEPHVVIRIHLGQLVTQLFEPAFLARVHRLLRDVRLGDRRFLPGDLSQLGLAHTREGEGLCSRVPVPLVLPQRVPRHVEKYVIKVRLLLDDGFAETTLQQRVDEGGR